MKTINQYRKTNSFLINGTDVESLSWLLAFFQARKQSVVAIATRDPEAASVYCARVIDRATSALIDYEVDVITADTIRITDSEIIVAGKLAVAA